MTVKFRKGKITYDLYHLYVHNNTPTRTKSKITNFFPILCINTNLTPVSVQKHLKCSAAHLKDVAQLYLTAYRNLNSFIGYISFNTSEMGKKYILETLKKFGQETTVHGVYIFAKYKLHFIERCFWAIIIILASTSAAALCLSNWRRYSANPTVVSLKKDFRNWNNPFPATTGCLLSKTDDVLADQYIRENWGINISHAKYHYYQGFIKAVANISYQSLEIFSLFQNDNSLNNVDMLKLAEKVHPKLTGMSISFATKRVDWNLIITEMGICFTANAIFSNALSLRRRENNFNKSILKCHYLNGLCYARCDLAGVMPAKFYIHSYLDVIHATSEAPWSVGKSQEVEINFRMQETLSDVSLRSLSIAQRKCRFEDEPPTSDFSAYSKGICYMECRYRMALKYCGCRPYFYHNLAGNVCNVSGLMCFARYVHVLTQSPEKLGCHCPQPCNFISYTPQVPQINNWEFGYLDQKIMFRWGLIPPTTKYRREILFSFEDLVVSFGGIVALFLGISFVSGIEIILFVIENIFSDFSSLTQNKNKKGETNNKNINRRLIKHTCKNSRISKAHGRVIQVQSVHNAAENRKRNANTMHYLGEMCPPQF